VAGQTAVAQATAVHVVIRHPAGDTEFAMRPAEFGCAVIAQAFDKDTRACVWRRLDAEFGAAPSLAAHLQRMTEGELNAIAGLFYAELARQRRVWRWTPGARRERKFSLSQAHWLG
jgi:hypothetical protein